MHGIRLGGLFAALPAELSRYALIADLHHYAFEPWPPHYAAASLTCRTVKLFQPFHALAVVSHLLLQSTFIEEAADATPTLHVTATIDAGGASDATLVRFIGPDRDDVAARVSTGGLSAGSFRNSAAGDFSGHQRFAPSEIQPELHNSSCDSAAVCAVDHTSSGSVAALSARFAADHSGAPPSPQLRRGSAPGGSPTHACGDGYHRTARAFVPVGQRWAEVDDGLYAAAAYGRANAQVPQPALARVSGDSDNGDCELAHGQAGTEHRSAGSSKSSPVSTSQTEGLLEKQSSSSHGGLSCASLPGHDTGATRVSSDGRLDSTSREDVARCSRELVAPSGLAGGARHVANAHARSRNAGMRSQAQECNSSPSRTYVDTEQGAASAGAGPGTGQGSVHAKRAVHDLAARVRARDSRKGAPRKSRKQRIAAAERRVFGAA